MSFESVKAKNKHLEFLNDDVTKIAQYGRFITVLGIKTLLEKADKSIVINLEQNVYVASDPELDTEENRKLFAAYFGGIDIQIGWVAGPNSTMNGMEYHKSSEILVALTDQVLLLGLQKDIDNNFQFLTTKAKALYLKRGECFELLPQTLHLSPCKTSDAGFKTLIILPRGTNLPLDDSVQNHDEKRSVHKELPVDNNRMALHENAVTGAGKNRTSVLEADLLFMKNKWLLAHPERKPLIEKGAFTGLVGENIRVWY